MAFHSVIKIELTKLLHKKTSLLLLLNFIIPLIYGVGAAFGASFIVTDGAAGSVDVVANGLTAMGFTVNMLGQIKYILFMVIIILSAISLSGELENGQIKSEVIRICSRPKIILAKYITLLIVYFFVFLLFVVWSLGLYYFLLSNSPYASGIFSDTLLTAQLYNILFTFIGVAVASAVTITLGLRLKVFACFAISYIAWFASLYSDFFGKTKLLIPYNWPDYILETPDANIVPYGGLFLCYCIALLALSVTAFRRMDIKV